MIISNHRLTPFEDKVLEAIKASFDYLCAKCNKNKGYNSFTLNVNLDSKYVNQMDCPINAAPHAFVYQQFIAGEIPPEHISIVCKTCQRYKRCLL